MNEQPQGRMHPPRCYTKENDGQLNHLTFIAEKHCKLASGPIAARGVRMCRHGMADPKICGAGCSLFDCTASRALGFCAGGPFRF